MSHPHGNQTFESFLAGSRDAFEYYYEQYVEKIYLHLLKATGDPSTAQDKTQETFVILYTERQKIRNESHLRPFLYAVAKKLMLKYFREQDRMTEYEAELAYTIEAHMLAPETLNPEEAEVEILMALRPSWLTLSARKRRIIVLYYWHKKTTFEIAARLNIDVQTVRNHLSQSIILLRKGLDGRWEEINLFF